MLAINRGGFFSARLRAHFLVPRKIEFCSSVNLYHALELRLLIEMDVLAQG